MDTDSKITIASKKDSAKGIRTNKDTNWDINVSGQVFNETKRRKYVTERAAIPYLDYIGEIVENAILLNTNSIMGLKAKSQNSLLMHSFYAVADIGNGPTLLKLYVEEMNDPNKYDTDNRAYDLQNIEILLAPRLRVQGNTPSPLNRLDTSSVDNVSDLVNVVKQHDKNYNPKPFNGTLDDVQSLAEGVR